MTEAAARRTPGTPCWVSLIVHSLCTTQEFYADLFGWEFVPGPDQLGPYVRALIDGKEVAGIGQLPPDRHLPVAWTTYLATDDADVTAEAIRSCGGRSASVRSTRPTRAGWPSSPTRAGPFSGSGRPRRVGTALAGLPEPRSGTSW